LLSKDGDSAYNDLPRVLARRLEHTVTRKVIDCRDFPSETDCTVAIAADTTDELLDVAVRHAVEKHGHDDTPELREMIRGGVKEGALT
jgi:predicted small metal-binding protein